MDAKSRILQFADNKGIDVNSLEKELSLSRNYFRNTSKVSVEVVVKFITRYSEVSPLWVLTGKEPMLKGVPPITLHEERVEGAIPYYSELPVSAGQMDLASFYQEEKPSGWVKIPGISAKGLFPVIGCSMRPEINPGDVVGLSTIDSWEIVDPDKIYLVITRDDRMIKHLMIDEIDKEILWCISPNYPKFSIRKDDIISIYRVTFHGKLM